MSDKKKGTDSTVTGLPEVSTSSTLEPLPTMPMDALDQITSPSLPAVVTVISPPPQPRTKTGGAMKGVVPKADTSPRRQSRVALPKPQGDAVTAAKLKPLPDKREAFEWTMPRVAGLAGGICLFFILIWVVWPSNKRKHRPVVAEPAPIAVEPVVVPPPRNVAAVAPVVAPKRPTFRLDSKTNAIDPFAAHLEDLELDPAHKYRLRIERDDSRLGVALARLDEKGGWGVMRKMASHAVLQFGGAKALRLHCEPGTHFSEGQTLPLELLDLATKTKRALLVNPAVHCWDFEVARAMDLGEGIKKRVRVPTDSKVELGEKITLRVAYILEPLGEKKEWRTGVLAPGESVLAEGRVARFAILDPYAADNEGTVELEILSGDTENSGLVTPSSATGAQFVK